MVYFYQKSFTNIGRFLLTYVTKLIGNYVLLQMSLSKIKT